MWFQDGWPYLQLQSAQCRTCRWGFLTDFFFDRFILGTIFSCNRFVVVSTRTIIRYCSFRCSFLTLSLFATHFVSLRLLHKRQTKQGFPRCREQGQEEQGTTHILRFQQWQTPLYSTCWEIMGCMAQGIQSARLAFLPRFRSQLGVHAMLKEWWIRERAWNAFGAQFAWQERKPLLYQPGFHCGESCSRRDRRTESSRRRTRKRSRTVTQGIVEPDW